MEGSTGCTTGAGTGSGAWYLVSILHLKSTAINFLGSWGSAKLDQLADQGWEALQRLCVQNSLLQIWQEYWSWYSEEEHYEEQYNWKDWKTSPPFQPQNEHIRSFV
jgi:hypothetical protein